VGQIPFLDFVLSFARRRFLPAFLTARSVNAMQFEADFNLFTAITFRPLNLRDFLLLVLPIYVPGEFGCLRDAASAAVGWIKVLQNCKKEKRKKEILFNWPRLRVLFEGGAR